MGDDQGYIGFQGDCWRRYFCYVKQQMAQHMAKGADDRSIPMSPPGVVSLVRQSVPEDTILCLDNGLYKVSNSLSNFPFRFKVAISIVALTEGGDPMA